MTTLMPTTGTIEKLEVKLSWCETVEEVDAIAIEWLTAMAADQWIFGPHVRKVAQLIIAERERMQTCKAMTSQQP